MFLKIIAIRTIVVIIILVVSSLYAYFTFSSLHIVYLNSKEWSRKYIKWFS